MLLATGEHATKDRLSLGVLLLVKEAMRHSVPRGGYAVGFHMQLLGNDRRVAIVLLAVPVIPAVVGVVTDSDFMVVVKGFWTSWTWLW
jgi:hypothetical protein